MVRISRFRLDEYKEIIHILEDAGIPFQSKPETIAIGMAGGYQEYHIFVAKEDVRQTIRLLKEYFGLVETTFEPFSGECPGCGFRVANKLECPDCGLSFSPRPVSLNEKHPFIMFLKERGLLQNFKPGLKE